jgi:hypothetical protein
LRSLRRLMDVFLAACQGLGLALAGGIVIASVLVLARAGRGAATRFLGILLAAAIGAALFALSLETETNSWWWGIIAGALAGAAAARLGGAILAGAAERARETAGTLGAIAAVAAIVLAALSLFISPIALVAAAGLVVLYMGRRRRAARKYEGLRSLR